MTTKEDYKERVIGAVRDFHDGTKVAPSFCEMCGAYLRPDEDRLCGQCRGIFCVVKEPQQLELFP
jgi:hypothetical protein